MWIKEKTIECPFCKSFLKNTDRSIYYNSDRSKPSDNSIASDGCGWAIITANFYDYAMCPKCRNVFNIQTGNNGKSTEFKNYEKPAWLLNIFMDNLFVLIGRKKKIDIEQKEVIRDGFEFYEKAIKVVEKSDDARYLILFEYIWRIERMEKDEKASRLVDYNEAISEILEMLERRNKKTFDLESDSIKDIEKSIYITELLLMAELYRRKGVFDRAIAILDEYSPKLQGYFKEFASEMSNRAKKKIPELFYLEINRSEEKEKVAETSAQWEKLLNESTNNYDLRFIIDMAPDVWKEKALIKLSKSSPSEKDIEYITTASQNSKEWRSKAKEILMANNKK